MEIHPNKIPGVPAFIVRPLLPALESVLKKLLAPNLTLLAKGVRGYLDSQNEERASQA